MATPCTDRGSDAGHRGLPGQRAHLGRGQKPAMKETAAAQDEGMNKGGKLKGSCRETESFELNRKQLGSMAKKYRENERTTMSRMKPDINRLSTVTARTEREVKLLFSL